MNRRQAILSTICGFFGLAAVKPSAANHVFPEVMLSPSVKNYAVSRKWIKLKDCTFGIQIDGFMMSESVLDIEFQVQPGFRRDSMQFAIDMEGTRIDFKVIDVPIGSHYP
jgi:hypothetical protein